MRQLLKKIAARFGMTSSDILWKPLAKWCYPKQISSLLTRDRVRKHWGHYQENDWFAGLHCLHQLDAIASKLKLNADKHLRVLDAGASDGFFLDVLHPLIMGVGVNILPECVANIKADGWEASTGDIENIVFKDNAFDGMICSETLEHTHNPIAVLRELSRVCFGTIYITIPWVDKTRIHPIRKTPPACEGHVFEFCPADFEKILTYTDLEIVDRDEIVVFPEPWFPPLRWWIGYWMYPNFFPKLQYYELRRKLS